MDQKQVCYLVPTTILANQQYEAFKERMKNYPIRIELLNRFRTKKEQEEIISKLKLGEIDIIIGTHRLLSKDVGFKDLGFLIVDEEHRFGVKDKEKIKKLKTSVDVLSMTATPIPRTLHMSIVGIRDMSCLYEPPQNRIPVQTYVLEYDEEVIREAITKELEAMENKYSDEIANLGGTGTLQRPVKSGVITATMYYSSGAYHGALDYGVPIGTNVYAAADGVVLQASWRSGGLGNCVVLQHSGGLRTYYGHGNGTFYVKPGQVVKKGQLIMLSGNTGNSSGPHLHFEVRVSPYNWSYGGNDSRRDPRNYM